MSDSTDSTLETALTEGGNNTDGTSSTRADGAGGTGRPPTRVRPPSVSARGDERMTDVAADTEIVMADLQRGFHAEGHHPYCATRKDEGCNCYARKTAPARAALNRLAALAAQVDTLTEGLFAAAWLCEFLTEEHWKTYECGHGATVDDICPERYCAAHNAMVIVRAALASARQESDG